LESLLIQALHIFSIESRGYLMKQYLTTKNIIIAIAACIIIWSVAKAMMPAAGIV